MYRDQTNPCVKFHGERPFKAILDQKLGMKAGSSQLRAWPKRRAELEGLAKIYDPPENPVRPEGMIIGHMDLACNKVENHRSWRKHYVLSFIEQLQKERR